MAGIPLHKSYNSAVVEAGGYENMTCIEKDCRNYVEQVRRLKLGEGDAAAIQLYFSKMQSMCSGFFFSMDLDEESRLRNIFWADNRSRLAYKEFGDVVTFDTTYLMNKYDMPFAPFVGVNHHGQSTLLGCSLLLNENTETFVWLFKTWLQCMHGQAPLGIITDQDRAMQNAIQIVLPNTKHRWCLWHILKKLPEKFGHHSDKGEIFSAIHVLVYDTETIDEFEEGCSAMIEKYNLHDNDWLSGLYSNRGRWRALRNKVEKEFQADFKSYSQMAPCATKYELEKQFQVVYTISKFREVQDEFIGKVYCDLISSSECFSGTRHAIAVLIRNNITSLPNSYILQRWRRDIDCKERTVGLTRSTGGSNSLAQQASQTTLHDGDGASHHSVIGSVQDPKCSNRKGAPKKLRRKSCLESNSNNAKGAAESPAFTQQQMSPNFIPLDPTNAMLYGSGNDMKTTRCNLHPPSFSILLLVRVEMHVIQNKSKDND
ncbi:protein FAR1-RELATED SEQUENCE 5-like [Olea europaea var. sylvestris]|uniref:protein FAR1-RELATED SEQUENCE 5-like n=1 Tax=Olea europaea var. sylvestris TaxID=158386 RepID=UPI000C1CEF0A|nr:protein FAR1-RELATED SEQUENCE 5-like [Olea europaea var. sylvestris]